MLSNYGKKNFRYFYWLVQEFIKKNARLIIISFLATIVLLISFLSLAPYIKNFFLINRQIIGSIGSYNEENLPEDIMRKISNGFLYINEKGEYRPAIASSWEIKENSSRFKVIAKNGLFWNDGRPFTVKNINFIFKDVDMLVLDDHIIEFKLKKPLPIFLNYLSKPIFRSGTLVGVSGLYKVDKIKKKSDYISEIYLSPNKKNLPIIVYKFFQNEKDLINAYKLGEINQMTLYKKNLADIFLSWKNTAVEKTIDYSRLLTLFINNNSPLLKEKEVRQAIALAFDRSKFKQLGQEANSPVPPISWAYNANLKKNTYDEELAKEIIKKYKNASDSPKLNLNTFYDYMDNLDLISEPLQRIDLSISTNIVSDNRSFDFLLAYWNVSIDPDQYFFWHSTQKEGNITNYKNLKVDKLLEDGRSTSSLEERKRIYNDFQKVIVDDNPAIFLYYPYIYTIKRK